ncbi:transaldolase [Azospirillum rugosum]|uniref:Transaldolase n=1 Tax=Azospirillum rugosum TaxID=416170 RepID=A0ABS4SP22_9PROT|nr:transaldolase [Azospirillum rugosum]MBP2294300.1 transaldolase [Azospirillum rugosum]MDQ0527635.1 transaldolase [Azospirillum rugosum]
MIELYQDGAELEAMKRAYASGNVQGFTTNPTLMRKAGITDYAAFARAAIAAIPDLPISFEVFSDDFPTMEREARIIRSWGGNTYVKIPITNTRGESAIPLIARLSAEGFSLNVTAILTLDQVEAVAAAVNPQASTIVSVFAGRIADTGCDPVPVMTRAAEILKPLPNAKLLWASPREVLNVLQAQDCGCHIITATPDILAKMSLFGKDLTQFSLETVRMFYEDARKAGYNLVEQDVLTVA